MYKNSLRENRSAAKGGVLATVAVAQLMVSLDVSVVNVALPTMRTSLGFDESGLSWVVNAYALAFGGLLLFGGRAADRFGRRVVLVSGLVLFGLMSLAGGLAQEPGQLIAARAAQGVGAALVAPAALAVLTTTFPSGRERAKAFAVYSAVTAGGAAVGVVAGGLLTEYINWRWVMLVNVPLVAVGLTLAARYVTRANAADTAHRLDVVGAFLATAGTVLLVLGLVRTTDVAWGSAQTVGVLALAVVLLTAFVVYEARYAKAPLLRLGVLVNRAVGGANLFMLIVSITMFTGFFFVSLYLQQVLGLNAMQAGLGFLPFCVGLIGGSFAAIPLLRRFDARALLIAGALVATLGLLWFTRIRADGTFWADVFGPSLLCSLGLGPLLVPIANTATAGAPPQEAGMVSGLLNSARQVGGSIGLATMSTIAVNVTTHASGSDSMAQRLTTGYSVVFGVNAGLLLVAVLVALFIIPRGVAAPAPAPGDEGGRGEQPAPMTAREG